MDEQQSRKRRKVTHHQQQQQQKQQQPCNSFSSSLSLAIPLTRPHPTNIKPLGNYYLDSCSADCHHSVLGLFSPFFTDLSFINFLQQHFSIIQLAALASISKAWYVYTHEEELYKTAVLEKYQGNFKYQQSW